MTPASIAEQLEAALLHHRAGRLREAADAYNAILQQNAGNAEAWHLLGVVAGQSGHLSKAIELVSQAIALQPHAEYYDHLGCFHRAQRNLKAAATAFEQAVKLQPTFAEAWNNLAEVHLALEEFTAAAACYRRLCQLQADSVDAHFKLGYALSVAGVASEASAAFRRVVTLAPTHYEGYNNLGYALQELGHLTDAASAFTEAIRLRPDYAEAHGNLANILTRQGQVALALKHLRLATSQKPDSSRLHSNLLLTLHYEDTLDPAELLRQHRHWAATHAACRPSPIKKTAHRPVPSRALKIGYVSSDLRDHVVARFLLPLLRNHNREEFEVYCYSNTRVVDALTGELRKNANGWRDTAGMPDRAVAAAIRHDEIDLLVDLSGHTAGNRLLVFAEKPAPIQLSWLGYPDTTGLDSIDYRITDLLADPPGRTEMFHTERLLRLPRTAWCYPDITSPPVAPAPFLRHGHITFGCFSNLAKINERLIRLWAEILRRVPRAKLVLKELAFANPSVCARYLTLFGNYGVDSSRLLLLPRDPNYQTHLSRYAEIDLALDSFPYHGTTTTCETLWMGVPLVTLAGHTHISRVGVSMLSNVELPQLISWTEDEYIERATTWAADEAGLLRLRSTLRDKMKSSPLMDGVGFARDMEYQYRAIWQTWCESVD